ARTIPESSIIIEYLDLHYVGNLRLVPVDRDLAWQTRLWDRFYDLYVDQPMQKVVTDRLRPAGLSDPHGVEEAKAQLKTAYGIIDQDMASKAWAMGDAFSMADCAAAPALFYANLVLPFGDTHRWAAAYLDRLMKRPSFAQVVTEAKPYFALFPK
ncbi:MAG: glutathione S-transferase family protein, partial [Gammaproteobacteria bacterium]|nr:glutathione S-transferase family protein [Gammaproteobacteria bacterium]